MSTNTTGSIDHIVSDFNKLKANQDFSGIAPELVALQSADHTHFQANLAAINKQVDMKKLGFAEDFQIVGVRGDQFVALSQDGTKVEYRQMKHMNTMQTVDNVGTMQPVGDHGRMMLVRPDGSGTYIAQANKGDCYWRVAGDVLQSRSGHPPTDTQVANFVNELAAYNNKKDPNTLAVGEKIEIPPPVVAPAPASAAEAKPEPALHHPVAPAKPEPALHHPVAPAKPEPALHHPVAPAKPEPALHHPVAPAKPEPALHPPLAPAKPEPALHPPLAPAKPEPALHPPLAPAKPEPALHHPVAPAKPEPALHPPLAPAKPEPALHPPLAPAKPEPALHPPLAPAKPEPALHHPVAPAKPGPDLHPPQIGLSLDSNALLPQGTNKDIYNPIAPPGQGQGAFGETWSGAPHGLTASRKLASSETDPQTGSKTDQYTGYLDDSNLFGLTQTSFRADETVNSQGLLTHRKIEYGSGWGLPSMQFETPDGTTKISHVSSVETTLDAVTHQYDTIIQDFAGSRWQAVSSPEGQVISFKPIAKAPENPNTMLITPYYGP